MRLIKHFPLLKFAATILSSLSDRWTQARLKVMMEYQFVCYNYVLLQYLNHCKFFTKTVSIMSAFLKHGRMLRLFLFIKKVKQLKKIYQPVSLLPVLEKNFQKIIFNVLFKYLDDNNLLSNSQSGFRSGGSCAHQLLAITSDIYI